MNRPGLTHLSFRVDDLDASLASLAAVGVAVREQTRVGVAAMRAHAVFVTDPDGTRIELVQAPGDPEKLPGEW
jgi:catechol 2,3-dioxygenase-like lactoylglutathione lyase family enzyme